MLSFKETCATDGHSNGLFDSNDRVDYTAITSTI